MKDTLENLISEYAELASAHGKATLVGDYKAANQSCDKLITLVRKIRVCGRVGEQALLALMTEQDDAVSCWSATHSLVADESRALAVLNELSKKPGPIGFDAKMVIRQWKKGQLVLP